VRLRRALRWLAALAADAHPSRGATRAPPFPPLIAATSGLCIGNEPRPHSSVCGPLRGPLIAPHSAVSHAPCSKPWLDVPTLDRENDAMLDRIVVVEQLFGAGASKWPTCGL
jgi:hypothetical protein